jgi:hypothetical protein
LVNNGSLALLCSGSELVLWVPWVPLVALATLLLFPGRSPGSEAFCCRRVRTGVSVLGIRRGSLIPKALPFARLMAGLATLSFVRGMGFWLD